MMTLFDDEQILEAYAEDIKNSEARKTAEKLIRKGRMSLDEIAECIPALTFDELKELEAEVMQLALLEKQFNIKKQRKGAWNSKL